ncbi:MAG TPA: TrmH family RNA methyltransferase, partial [Gammaproteobacteria bacterium]|nr:TrmH family RNA methyltransferase [Gammaproteobacteria bacterium]
MSGTIRIVLVATSHPGNVGAAARAMKVMGLGSLVLVAPQCEIGEEARARARGALDVLEKASCVDTLDEAIVGAGFVVATSARPRHLGPAVVAARDGAAELVAELAARDVAILFGPERSGLDNDALDRANRLWYIPTAGDRGSLNLAAAVQVIAYEVLLAINAALPRAPPPAAALAEDVAALCAHFDGVARSLGVI